MGAEPWLYFVPYCQDIAFALKELRETEFRAGRYRRKYVDRSGWQYNDWSGNTKEEIERILQQYGSTEAAIEAIFTETGPNGTASILDMFEVTQSPAFCSVSPFTPEVLMQIFGTDKPNSSTIASSKVWDYIERGKGFYIITYDDNGDLSEICFLGYSFD